LAGQNLSGNWLGGHGIQIYQKLPWSYAAQYFSGVCFIFYRRLGNSNLHVKALSMSEEHKNLRMILKFDAGADGFLKMIAVLAVSAIIVLITGIYFLNLVTKDLRQLQ
jgi:hypothetical protein